MLGGGELDLAAGLPHASEFSDNITECRLVRRDSQPSSKCEGDQATVRLLHSFHFAACQLALRCGPGDRLSAATLPLVGRGRGSCLLVGVDGDNCERKNNAKCKSHEPADDESPIHRLIITNNGTKPGAGTDRCWPSRRRRPLRRRLGGAVLEDARACPGVRLVKLPRLSCAGSRRSGRVAEGGALLRRYGGECLHRGFESLLLRSRRSPN